MPSSGTLVPFSILLVTLMGADTPRRISFGPAVAVGTGAGAASGQPISVTTADVDGDRLADLVVGFAEVGGGKIVVYRTNHDALWPNGPGVRERWGKEIPSFLPDVRSTRVPVRPDFIAADDFDNDGQVDVVFAEAGARHVWFAPGAGEGDLGEARIHDLPGQITALAAGEIDRADGLADLAIGVDNGVEAQLLVFEHPQGALRGEPEVYSLPKVATEIVLADLDGDFDRDAIALAGSEVLVVKGRDRKLTWPETQRSAVPRAIVERHALGNEPRGIAVGRVIDPARNGLVWLDEEGRASLARGREPERIKARSAGSRANSVLAAGLSGADVRDVVLLEREARHLTVRRPDGVEETIGLPGRPIAAIAMRLNADAVDDLVVLQEPPGSPIVALLSVPEAVFVVTNADASGPGSLTQAINDANSAPGIDAIHFDIPGTPPFLIPCPFATRTVGDAVTIDGTTQPGYAGEPLVALVRTDQVCETGLRLSGSSSAVHGLWIRDWHYDSHQSTVLPTAIVIEGSGNSIQGNWFTSIDRKGLLAKGPGFNEIGGIEPNLFSPGRGNIEPVQATTKEFLSFQASNVPVPIPDNGTVVSSLPLAFDRVLGDVMVTVNINHGDTGQLTLTLIHPDGTRVVLARNRGGTGDNFTNTSFRSPWGTPISAGTAPFDGTFNPEEPLSVLIGKSSQGTWKLEVNDNSTPTAGTLVSWRLDPTLTTVGNRIIGNRFGTDTAGNACIGSAWGPDVGGMDEEVLGNLASCCNTSSASISSYRARVQGNFFGTNLAGDAALMNGYPITVSSNALIGGTAVGAGNLINGAQFNPSLNIGGLGSVVQGNRFGTDVTGTISLGGRQGIWIAGDTDVLIGGDVPEARNVISGHTGTPAIVYSLFAPTVHAPTIVGNYVGTTADGLSPLPNALAGISLQQQASGVTIERNRIAFNSGAGVEVQGGSGNRIVENEILSNGGLGIDLGATGPNANDPLDVDTGANGLQNYPVLTSVSAQSGGTQLGGTVNSVPNSIYRLDFYGTATDEGDSWRGTTNVTTNASGDATFSFLAPGFASHWTATATASNGSTSEFSAAALDPAVPPAEASANGGMRANRSGGNVAVSYTPACDASDHAIVWGTSPIAGALSWTSAACGFGTAGLLQVALPNPSDGRFVYFVVVGQGATLEGSYGQNGTGVERPEATGLPVCDRPQSFAATCD